MADASIRVETVSAPIETRTIQVDLVGPGAGAALSASARAQKWAEEAEDVPVEPGEFSAKHHALKSGASAAAAAASAVEATALASFLDTTEVAEIDGVEPLAIIGLRGPDGVMYSFIAFMPDGSIVSPPIEALVTAQLGGVQISDVEAPGWGGYVLAQEGPDGLLYALNGVDAANLPVAAEAVYYYPPTPAQALSSPPDYQAAGWNGLIFYGQSLSIGTAAQPAISLTQPYSNLTFGSGPRSAKPGNTAGAVNTVPGTTTVKALVEDDVSPAPGGETTCGETGCSGAANGAARRAAIENAIDPSAFEIFASSAGKGSMAIGDLDKGSTWYNHILDHASEAKARATDAGKPYACQAVMYMQGEADAGAGTTRAAYKAMLLQLQADLDADIRALTGQTAPVHMLIYQTPSNPTTTLANLNEIQLAQFEAVNESDYIHFVGPLYHLPLGDKVHLNNIGQRRYGEYEGRAFKQLVIDGEVPDCLWPISATASGTTLRLKMRVPQPPLVLDTSFLNMATDYGFKVSDGTGTLTLSGIRIEGGDTVVMTLDRALGASPVIRYALDYLAPSVNILSGASGNLRDSTADTFTFGGVTYDLFHVAPHFELTIIALES